MAAKSRTAKKARKVEDPFPGYNLIALLFVVAAFSGAVAAWKTRDYVYDNIASWFFWIAVAVFLVSGGLGLLAWSVDEIWRWLRRDKRRVTQATLIVAALILLAIIVLIVVTVNGGGSDQGCYLMESAYNAFWVCP